MDRTKTKKPLLFLCGKQPIVFAILCFILSVHGSAQEQPMPLPEPPPATRPPALEALESRLREELLKLEQESVNPESGTQDMPSLRKDGVVEKLLREFEEKKRRLNQPTTEGGDGSGTPRGEEPTVVEAIPPRDLEAEAMRERLQLSDVIASTYRAFPLLEIARLQSGVAAGQQISAWGAYDTKLEYYSLSQPVGFYETYRNGIGVARQLWWGGYASAGYAIGRGSFEPWYRERQTDSGGEFKVGLVQPLLQGRAIDPHRVELFQANLQRQAVEPGIQHQVLIASLEASMAYWAWVEIGNVLITQERLLEIAVKRGAQLEKNMKAGWSSRLDVAQNAQLIEERVLKVNETKLKFRDTAFKLSMFLRDEQGTPRLPPPEWLPIDFPTITEIPPGNFEQDFQNAVASRPELLLINLDMQSLRLDLSLARNQTLPNVDMTLRATQDMGLQTSQTNDKEEFQLEAGIIGDVPIQRRKAFGKIQSTQAKLAQVMQKYEFQRNKIGVELQSARNALDIAQQNVVAARELLRLANETLSLFRLEFDNNRRDLFFLLGQEVKVNDSEVKLLEAERDFYIALARMQAALGLDPLEQSTLLTPLLP
jgi:outer membrane protein TolC